MDSDGISDQKTILLDMQRPNYVYDHAGILGLAAGPDGWLYVSRGNTGGQFWEIMGTDRTTLRGYGDGGNIIRCKMNGSSLEEVATGFWNPFDIKFTQEGRLLATDNDPDSRGPNRLLDIVSGGDYGYQSLYGGSGIHPYLAWNGELPGTLPYAAPLGEAPCALIDARYTNFGSGYSNHILVNIWEENNIVKVPLKSKGTTVTGQPTVWLQGDSLFHPVALATNSKGDLYISDWVIRQYPNHGHGRIWRISTIQPGRPNAIMPETKYLKRLSSQPNSIPQLKDTLLFGDRFSQTVARQTLVHHTNAIPIFEWLEGNDHALKLQALLIFLERQEAHTSQYPKAVA